MHLNIEHDNQSLRRLIFNSHFARAVVVPAKKGIFDEGILSDERLELGLGDKVVCYAFRFTRSRASCCVRDSQCKRFRVCVEELLDQGSFPDP